jgi:hypothetical protein
MVIPLEQVLHLMLAGKFIFNVKSLKTNRIFSYGVFYQKNQIENHWLVYAMGNPIEIGKIIYEKENFYFYEKVGFINELWKLKQKSFIFTFNVIKTKKEGFVEITTNGKCARCGIVLKNHESIELGIGPECIKKTQKFLEKMNLTDVFRIKS